MSTVQPAIVAAEGPKWPIVLLEFEKMIRPYAKHLAGQMGVENPDLDALIGYLVAGMVDWFTRLLAYQEADLIRQLKNAKGHGDALKQALVEIVAAPGLLQADVIGPQFTSLRKLLDADRWLVIYSGETKRHFGSLIEEASSLVEPIDRTFDEQTRGRPRGILGYPMLHRLIFHLAYGGAQAGFTFSAYPKENGKTKVAVGTLIETLDSFRKLLEEDQDWAWLTKYLPPLNKHQYHIATYRRLLKAAGEARAAA